MIADPLFAGATHETVAEASWAVAAWPVGATGVPATIEFVAADCGPVPRAFTAAILNVYVVPFVRPVTVWVLPLPNVCGAWAVEPT